MTGICWVEAILPFYCGQDRPPPPQTVSQSTASGVISSEKLCSSLCGRGAWRCLSFLQLVLFPREKWLRVWALQPGLGFISRRASCVPPGKCPYLSERQLWPREHTSKGQKIR